MFVLTLSRIDTSLDHKGLLFVCLNSLCGIPHFQPVEWRRYKCGI